jgi:membrane protease YdiL (CAAX protease family)
MDQSPPTDSSTASPITLEVIALQVKLDRNRRLRSKAIASAETTQIGRRLVEAGLVEEFFLRALIQSQLTSALKSEVSGVALMSLIFGLAHAPGFIFRHAAEVEGLGSNPSALHAVAYTIVVLVISGITFGVIWARTKNLFAVMLIHAAGDLLPNFAGFVQTWL